MFPGLSEYCLCYLTVQRNILPGYEPRRAVLHVNTRFEWRLLQRQHRFRTGQSSSATKRITLAGGGTSLTSSRQAAVSKQSPKNLKVSLTKPTTPDDDFLKDSQGLASASTPLSLHLQHHRMISLNEHSSYMLRFKRQARRESKRRREKRKEERRR